jgi:hypothetical protein
VNTHYGKLEACLAKWGTPFFAGAKPAGGDFHAFEMMDQHEGMVRIALLEGREARTALASSIHRAVWGDRWHPPSPRSRLLPLAHAPLASKNATEAADLCRFASKEGATAVSPGHTA